MEAPVVWLSHRGATRRRIGAGQAQPGWWLDLDGPFALERPLTLTDLRARGSVVGEVLEELRARTSGSLYFPFSFYGGRELRPMQPYLNKLPAALLRALGELGEADQPGWQAPAMLETRTGNTTVGADYRVAQVSSLPDQREPFSVDPAVVERGLRGHAETQNALAHALRAAGVEPRSPRPDEPNFDLAWQRGGVVYVAEVKSITDLNGERQLRLGLGQVLRYRDLLGRHGHAVIAVLVAERQPLDPSWRRLCDELGVILIAPGDFDAVLE